MNWFILMQLFKSNFRAKVAERTNRYFHNNGVKGNAKKSIDNFFYTNFLFNKFLKSTPEVNSTQ